MLPPLLLGAGAGEGVGTDGGAMIGFDSGNDGGAAADCGCLLNPGNCNLGG